MTSGSEISLFILGKFHLQIGDKSVDRLRTRKTEGLLAWLAVHEEKSFSRQYLADLFWPEDDASTSRNKLRLALHSIRTSVGDSLDSDAQSVRLRRIYCDANVQTDADSQLILLGYDGAWVDELRQSHELRKFESTIQTMGRAATQSDGLASTEIFALIAADPQQPEWYVTLWRTLIRERKVAVARSLALLAGSLFGESLPEEMRSTGTRWQRKPSFVGRSLELAQIANELFGEQEPKRLLLVGSGGIGKTRLAQEALRLASASDLDVAIARCLGVVEQSDLRNKVVSALAAVSPGLTAEGFDSRELPPTVLLLDNVEDLNPEAEAWLSTLLVDGSSLRILATSQRRIPGWERETLNLSPLRWRTKSSADVRKSESAQLLARQADLDLDEIPVHELAEAVRLLGGVPLAIQLFAAQLRKEPLASAVAALAANQTDAIGVFDHPEQRHQNFAACVNWSLSVAGPVVESNLVALCCFPNGFTRETAGALGISGSAIDELMTGGWVFKREDSTALEILPPVQRHLAHRITPEHRSRAEQAIFDYFTSPNMRTFNPQYYALVEPVHTHAVEVRAAIENGLRTGEFTGAAQMWVCLYQTSLANGTLFEDLPLLERILGSLPTVHALPEIFNTGGGAYFYAGDYQRATESFWKALEVCDEGAIGVTYSNIGITALHGDQFAQAEEWLRTSMQYTEELPRRRLLKLMNIAEVLIQNQQFEEGQSVIDEALTVHSPLRDVQVHRAMAYGCLADLEIEKGNLDAAVAACIMAKDIYSEFDEKVRWQQTVGKQAYLAARRGARPECLARLEEMMSASPPPRVWLDSLTVSLWLLGNETDARFFAGNAEYRFIDLWARRAWARHGIPLPPNTAVSERKVTPYELRLSARASLKRT